MHYTINEAIEELSYVSKRKLIHLLYCKLHSIYDTPVKNIN